MARDCCAATAGSSSRGRIDVQVVRNVEHMRDERAFDGRALQMQVEVGERDRMSKRRRGTPTAADDGETQNAQNAQNIIALRFSR
jgi:hypothetical protein